MKYPAFKMAAPVGMAAMAMLLAAGCSTMRSLNPFAHKKTAPAAQPAPTPDPAADAYAPPAPPEVPGKAIDTVVASVDGQPVTTEDIQKYGDKATTPGMGPQFQTKSNDPNAILKAIITQKMLENEAGKFAGKVDDGEVDRYIANVENEAHINDAQLRQQLQQQGMSYDDFRAKVRRQVEAMTMIDQEVRQKIVIPDSEVAAYYKSHPQDFTVSKEQFELAQILIAVPKGATPDQVAAARKKADKIHKLLVNGGDFAALAMKYSDDDSKTKGGELGGFAPDDINDQILAGIRNLNDGQISPVIQTRYGFHIIKVEEHQRPGEKPLSEVSNEIRNKLTSERAKEEFQKWVDTDLIKDHYVETVQ
jgi:peptidyl-prolyl cis-trans isomerase SurA